MLRPFAADKDRDIFAARTDDVRAAGDGSGAPAGDLDDEIRAAVAGSTPKRRRGWWPSTVRTKIGMVFGELAGGEVKVRIWIHPASPQAGLRHSRAAQVALGDGRVLPGGAAGGARAGRRDLIRRNRTFCPAAAAASSVSAPRSTCRVFATSDPKCHGANLGAPPRDSRSHTSNISPNGNMALNSITCGQSADGRRGGRRRSARAPRNRTDPNRRPRSSSPRWPPVTPRPPPSSATSPADARAALNEAWAGLQAGGWTRRSWARSTPRTPAASPTATPGTCRRTGPGPTTGS